MTTVAIQSSFNIKTLSCVYICKWLPAKTQMAATVSLLALAPWAVSQHKGLIQREEN